MAIEEHDREDLLRDGRMMPHRGECEIDGVQIIVGFRGQGQLSVYCGTDPVFQFNASKQLRRVFHQGRRFTAENGTLVELTREHRGGKVEFASHRVDSSTLAIILSCWRDWRQVIRGAARSDKTEWRIVGGRRSDFRNHLSHWLETDSTPTPIADAPNA